MKPDEAALELHLDTEQVVPSRARPHAVTFGLDEEVERTVRWSRGALLGL
ncbi:hypothetical protein BH23ACT4_BH23ACT4_06650 [soil metagenome]